MLLSVLWVLMLLGALLAGILSGTASVLSAAALEGAGEAITLTIAMAGSVCLWSGLSRVMEEAGVSARIARILRPLLRKIFPDAFRDERAAEQISTNFTANLLGLGNAATPAGIAAVRRMKELNGGERASDEMCRLIVLNTASIQLIPSTVAAARSALGAAQPFDILPAVWLTSLLSAGIGVLAAVIIGRCSRG